MNQETKRKLQQLADAAEKQQATAAMRPQILERAAHEFGQAEQQLRTAIASFNSNKDVQRLSLSIKLDGPVNERGGSARHYTLTLLKGGINDFKSKVELILPYTIQEHSSISVKEWDTNYVLRAVTEGMHGYPPGQWPKIQREEKFDFTIVDSIYEWVPERKTNGVGHSFTELIDYIIQHKLLSQFN